MTLRKFHKEESCSVKRDKRWLTGQQREQADKPESCGAMGEKGSMGRKGSVTGPLGEPPSTQNLGAPQAYLWAWEAWAAAHRARVPSSHTCGYAEPRQQVAGETQWPGKRDEEPEPDWDEKVMPPGAPLAFWGKMLNYCMQDATMLDMEKWRKPSKHCRSSPEPLEWEHWLQDPRLPEN